MTALTRQRCIHHETREAVARCPVCARFYCRECIVEHEGRVVCASCLAKEAAPAAAKGSARRRLAPLRRLAGAGAGLIVAWLAFYFLGRVLLAVPSDFHASKIWEPDWTVAEDAP